MIDLRPLVENELRRLERERRAAADRHVVDELRRGLRGRLPQYDLPPVLGSRGGVVSDGRGAPEPPDPEEAAPAELELFPAGDLATVSIAPDPVEVEPGHEHRARAEARDGDGRLIRRGVTYRWSMEGAGFSLRGEGARPAVTAEAATRPGATARLRVEVEQGARTATAEATVEAVEPLPDEAGFGIPEPHLVDASGETWRSRFDGRRWEVNQMHEDYLALKGEARARLRYLLALLAKDLSQHAHRVPGAVEASEDVAAILALVERNLRGA